MTSIGTRADAPLWTTGYDRRMPNRINVAVLPETVHALELVIEREGVSLTEAVRRLIGYGEFVYKSVSHDGTELLLRSDASVCEVVLR